MSLQKNKTSPKLLSKKILLVDLKIILSPRAVPRNTANLSRIDVAVLYARKYNKKKKKGKKTKGEKRKKKLVLYTNVCASNVPTAASHIART